MYIIGLFAFLLSKVQILNGEEIICRFNTGNLKANCRYRLDGVTMSVITASINKCNDPIDVSFNIKNDNPHVDWSHSFSASYESANVVGFDKTIALQVSLSYDKKNDFVVVADFVREKMAKAYFLNSKIHITGTEDCVTLNKAGRIAVGCLIALLVIASALLVILLYMRRRRRLIQRQNQELIQNIETPCEPDCPVGQPTVRFNAQAHQQAANQNSSSSHVTFLPNGQITNTAGASMPV